MGWTGGKSWVRLRLDFKEFISWHGRKIGTTKTHSDLRGASAVGFEKGWGDFCPVWFSCMRTFQTLIMGVCPYPSESLTPSLPAPWKLPILFSDILFAPFLLFIAQRPFGSGSLVCSSFLVGPGFLDSGTCIGSLLMAALMSSGMAWSSRHQPTSLALFYLGVGTMDHFMDKIAFELGLERCMGLC